MTVTSGFFNSQNGDRLYNAEDIGSMFEGLLNDGVFSEIGSKLVVSADTGMNVSVGSGKAWYQESWLYNDAAVVLPITASDPAQGRIDIVVMDFDKTDGVRANTLKVVEGTPSGSPVPPSAIDVVDHKQVVLAEVTVGAGVTSITAPDIDDKVGTPTCPYIFSALEQRVSEELLATWESTYLKIVDAAATYETIANAAATYLTQANAASTYLTQANAAITYGTTQYVPLLTPAEAVGFQDTSFSGQQGSSLTLSVHGAFGIPTNAIAVVMDVNIKDSASWGAGSYYFFLGPSSSNWFSVGANCYGADYSARANGVLPLDAGGNAYYRWKASGTNTLDVYLRVWGYFVDVE